jgi:hypothetical protein
MLRFLGESTPQPLSPQQMWIFLGLGVMGLIYFTIVRPMMRRKRDPLEKAPFASLSQQRATERQMQNLLVELSEMARQVSAQLDTRAAKLEILIQQADDRIAKLNASSDSADACSVPASSPAPPESPIPEPPDPRHADIYALADEGREAHEIASQLNRPRGEVELILALRSK